MMRVKNQPLADDPSLIRNVQEEVAVENRPFLEFITRNAKYIIAIVVALILALAGTGLYRYMQKSEQEKVQTQLARIQQQKPDAAQLKVLEDLAAGTPERLQPAVNAVLVQSALAQGKFEVAAAAYGRIARDAADKPLGFAALLGQAGSLCNAGKYDEGITLLQSAIAKAPVNARGQINLMLAEAAARAGKYDLSAKTFDELAGGREGSEADYYRQRAADVRELEKQAKAEAAKPAEEKK